MNGNQDITYSLDFRDGKLGHKENTVASLKAEVEWRVIPRIARLMALAIRFEGNAAGGDGPGYRHLATDIQEKILFMPPIRTLNERNLRPVVSRIDWQEQRRLFQKICATERD